MCRWTPTGRGSYKDQKRCRKKRGFLKAFTQNNGPRHATHLDCHSGPLDGEVKHAYEFFEFGNIKKSLVVG